MSQRQQGVVVFPIEGSEAGATLTVSHTLTKPNGLRLVGSPSPGISKKIKSKRAQTVNQEPKKKGALELSVFFFILLCFFFSPRCQNSQSSAGAADRRLRLGAASTTISVSIRSACRRNYGCTRRLMRL